MVLILSNDGDFSTDLVLDWLAFYNHPFVRLNSNVIINDELIFNFDNQGFNASLNKKILSFKDINAVWLRKFGHFRSTKHYKKLAFSRNYDFETPQLLHSEFNRVTQTFFAMLSDKKWLTKYTSTHLNKILMLKMASECGLLIPKTKVINRKEMINPNNRYISKSLENSIDIKISDDEYGFMYTARIDDVVYHKLPNEFAVSLIQEEVEKDYEIRVFYICGKSYPMAIFSQNDPQTKIDFRVYNFECPNRCVPCDLSSDIQHQIQTFMERIDLNCGSLDFIWGTDGKLYFLEVNPTGQFGMIDFPCNYGLHKIVAETLIKMDTI